MRYPELGGSCTQKPGKKNTIKKHIVKEHIYRRGHVPRKYAQLLPPSICGYVCKGCDWVGRTEKQWETHITAKKVKKACTDQNTIYSWLSQTELKWPLDEKWEKEGLQYITDIATIKTFRKSTGFTDVSWDDIQKLHNQYATNPPPDATETSKNKALLEEKKIKMKEARNKSNEPYEWERWQSEDEVVDASTRDIMTVLRSVYEQ